MVPQGSVEHQKQHIQGIQVGGGGWQKVPPPPESLSALTSSELCSWKQAIVWHARNLLRVKSQF